MPNDELYENPRVQQWLQRFGGLRREDFPTLQFAIGQFAGVKIPLFKDKDTGDEYQVCLNFGHSWDGLANIWCPEGQILGGPRHPLRAIRYRIPPPRTTRATQHSPPAICYSSWEPSHPYPIPPSKLHVRHKATYRGDGLPSYA